MARVRMKLVVEWKGNAEAQLFYLLDGGIPVSLAGKDTLGRGKITVAYLADDTGNHLIEWGLTFPDRTLKGLAASASVSGGELRALASADEKQHRWVAKGRVAG
jgi:hypothetical protein